MSSTYQPPPPDGQERRGPFLGTVLATDVRVVGQALVRRWNDSVRWLRANTFSPPWLPPAWGHPLTGYVLAVLVQGLASALTLLLVLAYHGFPFPAVLALLGIVLTALTFGAGPSLLATGAGALLVDILVVPRDFAWPLASVQNVVALTLFVVAGGMVSVVASRAEHARRIAEEATRDRERFLILAAHELNTPLMLIHGSVDLLIQRFSHAATVEESTADERGRLIAQAQPVLARIEASAERMGRLIEEMLQYLAIQAGRLEVSRVPSVLGPIVREVVSALRLQHEQRTIRLQVPDVAITVVADADRIGWVVTQYVSNALKFSPEDRPVTVVVEVRGDQARVSVHDEGPGLSPDEQERVWEAFYRAPGVEVQSGSNIGLGLGLLLCRAIVEQHGGQTGVESMVGHGATFWFTLPLAPTPVV